MSIEVNPTESMIDQIALPSIGVVIPCYTEARWYSLIRAIDSAVEQPLATQVVVVVDHNQTLLERLLLHSSTSWSRTRPGLIRFIANRYGRGVSGARNSGAELLSTEFIAFLDDDAAADTRWLDELVSAFDDPTVVGAGGPILPAWARSDPFWFPIEFGWVFGITGPEAAGPAREVRNVWSVNMMVRRSTFERVSGFRVDFGKLGAVAEPEDTDLCLRMSANEGARWVMAPGATVRHEVPADRTRIGYFLKRCWQEGAGKRALRASSGDQALSSESAFLRSVLPRAIGAHMLRALRGDLSGVLKAVALVAGTAVTAGAFLLTGMSTSSSRT